MYLRRCYRVKDGKRHAYWALVESYRTQRGPRQRVVAYLGDLDEAGREGVREVARSASGEAVDDSPLLFCDGTARCVEIGLPHENLARFGSVSVLSCLEGFGTDIAQ
jgi:hypothetical protein